MNIMTFLLAVGLIISVLATSKSAMAAESNANGQIITKAKSQPAIKGSSDLFTGNVSIEMLFSPKQPDAPFSGAYVHFEPGARSHWHTHPTGQHLVVISGTGLTGTADGKVQEFKSGDVLWCPKDIKHWHGASPTSAMTHMALTGTSSDGKNATWMEPVTDEQYLKRS